MDTDELMDEIDDLLAMYETTLNATEYGALLHQCLTFAQCCTDLCSVEYYSRA